jgi:hypothetical protein
MNGIAYEKKVLEIFFLFTSFGYLASFCSYEINLTFEGDFWCEGLRLKWL